MSPDDKETTLEASPPDGPDGQPLDEMSGEVGPPVPTVPLVGHVKGRLPPRVERALADARAAVKADHARKEGRWLAVFPALVGLLLLLLMMPRATAPEAIPLPRLDTRVIGAIERADDARAAAAETERLPGYILAVGSAFRGLNGFDARGGDEVERIDARRRLEGAVRDLPRAAAATTASAGAAGADDVEAALVALRALQLRRFISALAAWETNGESSDDLVELGGGFLDRAEEAGWVVDDHSRGRGPNGHRLLMNESARRVAFKLVWNTLVGVDGRRAFALSLDEERALYLFYLEHPRTPEIHRLALAAERASASTPEACARATADEHREAELWRADKIKRLGAIDPAYPTAYALGVAYYRAGRFDLATEAFTSFIGAHPDGPYALRAKNHLNAALAGRATF